MLTHRLHANIRDGRERLPALPDRDDAPRRDPHRALDRLRPLGQIEQADVVVGSVVLNPGKRPEARHRRDGLQIVGSGADRRRDRPGRLLRELPAHRTTTRPSRCTTRSTAAAWRTCPAPCRSRRRRRWCLTLPTCCDSPAPFGGRAAGTDDALAKGPAHPQGALTRTPAPPRRTAWNHERRRRHRLTRPSALPVPSASLRAPGAAHRAEIRTTHAGAMSRGRLLVSRCRSAGSGRGDQTIRG